VWRQGLWQKLLKYNINGKCFTVIKNMYHNIKSRIKSNNEYSDFFPCMNGVRQGENLSPLLFAIYLNDLENYLCSENVKGIECKISHKEFGMYFKLFIILYADDTVLLSETSENLQENLNIFDKYCKEWKLQVNTQKTKVLIFGSRSKKYNNYFKFNETILETTNEYKYLGLYLSRTKSFKKTKQHIADQANKAMFSLQKKIRSLNLTIDLQVDLFNKAIKPILLYGCEIWGFSGSKELEKIQLKFFKMILNLKKTTPSYMIYGELGVKPLQIDINSRIINFWCKLTDITSNKLSNNMYLTLYGLHDQGKLKSKWLMHIKDLVTKNGFGNIWQQQIQMNRKWFPLAFKQKINDQYLQEWNDLVTKSTCSINYKLFKNEFGTNKYLNFLPNYFCKIITSFRTRNHRLPVEVGRWTGVPYTERKCTLCNLNEVGDEFHYIFNCKFLCEERKKFIKPYYYRNPNILKFSQLLNIENKQELIRLGKFMDCIMKLFRN
jgi:hypothetical protein